MFPGKWIRGQTDAAWLGTPIKYLPVRIMPACLQFSRRQDVSAVFVLAYSLDRAQFLKISSFKLPERRLLFVVRTAPSKTTFCMAVMDNFIEFFLEFLNVPDHICCSYSEMFPSQKQGCADLGKSDCFPLLLQPECQIPFPLLQGFFRFGG